MTMLPEHGVARLETSVAHQDPFDERLLAQAQVEGMRLLTRDRLLAGPPLVLQA